MSAELKRNSGKTVSTMTPLPGAAPGGASRVHATQAVNTSTEHLHNPPQTFLQFSDRFAVMARSQLSLEANQRGYLTCRVVMCLSLNLFSQYRRTSDVFPTQPSPNSTALNE